MTIDSRHWVWVAGAAAAIAYGWWLTGLRPFTWSSRIALSIPAVAVIAAAVRLGGHRIAVRQWARDLARALRATSDAEPRRRARARSGALWGVLILIFTVVQVYAYFAGFGGDRSAHPTLSWIVGHIEWRAGRTALFLGWLAFGLALVRR